MTKINMTITGMMCTNCETNVKKALEAVPGVSSADVDWEAGTAVVTADKAVSDQMLKDAVEGMASKRDFTVTSIATA